MNWVSDSPYLHAFDRLNEVHYLPRKSPGMKAEGIWYLYDIANLWSHGLGWIAWNNDVNERRAYMEKYMQTVINGYRTECTITDEELEHLEMMVNAVLMENFILNN